MNLFSPWMETRKYLTIWRKKNLTKKSKFRGRWAQFGVINATKRGHERPKCTPFDGKSKSSLESLKRFVSRRNPGDFTKNFLPREAVVQCERFHIEPLFVKIWAVKSSQRSVKGRRKELCVEPPMFVKIWAGAKKSHCFHEIQCLEVQRGRSDSRKKCYDSFRACTTGLVYHSHWEYFHWVSVLIFILAGQFNWMFESPWFSDWRKQKYYGNFSLEQITLSAW